MLVVSEVCAREYGAGRVREGSARGVWADPQPVPPWEWRKGLLSKGKRKTAKPVAPSIKL